METVFFYYTVIVIAVCASATISALGALAISNNSRFIPVAAMFAFYAVDLVVIFEGEYMNHGSTVSMALYYGIDDWPVKTALAAGVLESAWLIACNELGEERLAYRVLPVVAFCVANCLTALLIPNVSPYWKARQMLFYSEREMFIAFILIYCAIFYIREQDPLKKQRLQGAKWVYFVVIPLTISIVAENSFTILIWNPTEEDLRSLMLLYLSSRNFSENTLMLICAIVAMRSAWRTFTSHSLLLSREESGTSESRAYIDSLLPIYANKHSLTKREVEILRLIVQGKDNQNIASELQVALGTVKSHTHNIMRKTDSDNRDELIKDFWSTL